MTMADPNAEYLKLMSHFGLTDRNCQQEVTEKHLGDIPCSQWERLPPYLNIRKPTSTVVSDVQRNHHTEEEKRVGFFRKWKKENGFDATYEVLIRGLLGINCRSEAEEVCKLLLSTCPIPSGAHNMLAAPESSTVTGRLAWRVSLGVASLSK